MMKILLRKLIILVFILSVSVLCFNFSADAETWGDYEYVLLEDGTVEIKKYNGNSDELDIPSEINGVSITSIGNSAFSHCPSIKKIVIPEKVKIINSNTFTSCTSLSEIVLPEGLETIGNHAFRLCTSLTEIELPDSVKKIGWGAFSECNALVNVILSDNLEEIPNNTFSYCKSLEEIKIPNNVNKIGDGAFLLCSKLKSVYFPFNLKYLGEAAFRNCSSLENVELPEGITDIKSDTFENCINLKSVNIPNSVVNIGYKSFASCENITFIEITDDVKYIDSYAFDGCKKLEEIEIGSGLEKIDTEVFINCSALTEIKVDEQNSFFSSDEYGVLFDEKKTELVKYPPNCSFTSYTVPESVKCIKTNAFSYCGNLLTLKLHDDIEEIGENAFDSSEIYNNKANWTDGVLYIDNCIIKADSDVSECDIKPGTVLIADRAYFNCKKITDISIPDSVKYIGNLTFSTCTAVTQLDIGKGVKSIGRHAFQNCDKIKSISIPDTVEFLDVGAFSDCTGLINVVIGKGVDSIKNYTFMDCSSLANVKMSESVKTIGDYAFLNCIKLYSIELPGELQKIGEGAFWGCINLRAISVPKKVESIGDGAFAFCMELSEVTFPITEKPMSIGVEAFLFCESLESVTIPYTVESIGEHAFGYCLNDQLKYKKNNYFSITGHDDSAALKYASKNGFLRNTIHFYEVTILEEPTCDKVGKKSYLCLKCGYERILNMHKKEHNYLTEVQKAGLYKEGKVVKKCLDCEYSNTTMVDCPKTFILSTTAYTYDGIVKTPTVTVKDSKGNILKNNTDYTVKYASGRKKTGKYAVTITFKGNYSGTKTLYFTILPKSTAKVTATQKTSSVTLSWNKVAGATGYGIYRYDTAKKKWVTVAKKVKDTKYTVKKLKAGTQYIFSVKTYKTVNGTDFWSQTGTRITTATKPATVTLSKVTAGSKQATLNWKTVAGATGYEIQYSTNSNFKSAKKATVTKQATKKKTIKKLTKGKKYYFKVRAYKTVNGKKIYGGWSAVKNVKIK